MSDNEWPDELNFMHLRRLDLQDGGDRAKQWLKKYGVPVQVNEAGQVVNPPLEKMQETLQALNHEAARVVKIN